MTVEQSAYIFFQKILEFQEKKKANPYFCCNYRKPLKGKKILERLTTPK